MERRSISLASDEWTKVLEKGFGARVHRLSGDCLVTVFKAGPFRIAYPDFPAGAAEYTGALVGEIREWAQEAGITLVRLLSYRPLETGLKARVTPMSSHVIPDLQAWSERGFEKSRRAANRSRRTSLAISALTEADADSAFDLYRSTLLRHGGTVRYRREYFREFARTGSGLVARSGDSIAGFVCMGMSGDRACYLHGAHDVALRSYYPSDQLFLAMIRKCQEEGARTFDFLPSPPDQHSLKSYKESWGAGEEKAYSTDMIIRPLLATTFYASLRASDALGRKMRQLQRMGGRGRWGGA